MFTLRHIIRLLLLIIILSPCCACWRCFSKPKELYLNETRDFESLIENLIEKNYLGQALDSESLLKSVPDSISSLPRLIVGRGRADLFEEGCINLRDQDITMDSEGGKRPDICGNAWDINDVQKVKDIYSGGFSAIIFERIGIMPLDWSAYLRVLCTRPDNTFYQLPYPDSSAVHRAYIGAKEYRSILKRVYDQGGGFFHKVEEVKLPTWSDHRRISSLSDTDYPDPELVRLIKSDEAFFQGELQGFPQLEAVLDLKTGAENEVLKAYYELLKPGGMIIFSSSANVINRHGGLIVEFEERKYAPFKDLDDPHMQAVYRNIFERAGFRDVQFYKDPYYREQVIMLAAIK